MNMEVPSRMPGSSLYCLELSNGSVGEERKKKIAERDFVVPTLTALGGDPLLRASGSTWCFHSPSAPIQSVDYLDYDLNTMQ